MTGYLLYRGTPVASVALLPARLGRDSRGWRPGARPVMLRILKASCRPRPLSALDVGEAGAADEQWESATGQPQGAMVQQWCNNGATTVHQQCNMGIGFPAIAMAECFTAPDV